MFCNKKIKEEKASCGHLNLFISDLIAEKINAIKHISSLRSRDNVGYAVNI
jgi:hypothetical protein